MGRDKYLDNDFAEWQKNCFGMLPLYRISEPLPFYYVCATIKYPFRKQES